MTDVELDVVHGRKEPRNVPIYIGATGPKMMALTGEIADGAVLNYPGIAKIQRDGDGAVGDRRPQGGQVGTRY